MSVIPTGGCQCGAVRYRVTGGFGGMGLCHCRMCQRATGGAFAPLVTAYGVEWQGELARFQSSDVADRGFCRDCGTPLTYDPYAEDGIELMVGTLDDPNIVAPRRHAGVEHMVRWLHFADDLPRATTQTRGAAGGGPETIVSYQYALPEK